MLETEILQLEKVHKTSNTLITCFILTSYHNNIFSLTNSIQMEFPFLINQTNPFTILGVLSGIFHFYTISNRTFC